jgi:hypothetical protein
LQKVQAIESDTTQNKRGPLQGLAEKVRAQAGNKIDQAFADLLLNEITFVTLK